MKVLHLFILTLLTGNGEDPKDPQDGVFVIRGVQIWQESGPLTGPHDIVIEGKEFNRISLPGQSLSTIPGAKEIEGENWVVYPGLVHANFPANISDPPPNPFHEETSDPREGPIPTMEYGERVQFRGWLHVADTLEWDPEKANEWRNLGFTSAQVLPTTGLIRGRTAHIALNGLPLGQALLSYSASDPMVWSLSPARGGGYPRTPMGALALLRQARLDATKKKQRPDPDLENPYPALFLANGSRTIENVLDLVEEFPGQGPTTLLGGKDAWKHADRLSAQRSPVLWTIDLPEKPKTDEELKIQPLEERPYWQPPSKLRDEKRALDAEAVSGFAKLQNSGVECALVPEGSTSNFKKDVSRLRESGLSDETIWKALSLDVQTLLWGNHSWRKSGSTANFVIHRGPVDLEEFDPAWIFADGRGWEFPTGISEEKKETPEEPSEADAGIAGDWSISMETPRGERKFGAELQPAKSKVLLFDEEDPKSREPASNIIFSGNKVEFTFSPPQMPVEMTAALVLSGDKGKGTVETPFGEMEVSVERFSHDPVAKTSEIAQKEEEKGTESELGHPEWPVEIRSDRISVSDIDGDLLLKGATLYTLEYVLDPVSLAPTFAPSKGDILIEAGKIVAVAPEINPIRAVPTMNASSWHVMPGIIDAHSHLALASVNEGTVSISAECRIGDMIEAEDVGIFRAAAGGCAVAQSLHGSANPIGGQAAVWEMDYSRQSIADLLVPGAKQGIKFALGENVKQSNWDNAGKRFPNSRMGVEAVYRRAFTAAEDYAKQATQHIQGVNPDFRRDVRLETLAAILNNDIHIQCHSYRADEILMFLEVCRDFGIERPTFQHVLEGYKVAPELAKQGAMASTFSDWWAYKFEVIDAIPWNVAMMDRAGVVATINSDSDEMIRRLNTEAAKSIRYGEMDPEETLAFCARNAAIQLQLEDRLGTLTPGKDGTLSIFDGHPASTYSRCLMTLARGKILFARDEERDSYWEKYEEAVRTFATSIRDEQNTEIAVENTPSLSEFDAWTRPGQGESLAIFNATIHPVSSPPFKGAIFVEDGKIIQIQEGDDFSFTNWPNIVDAKGQHLYPGFLNGCDKTGIFEVGSVSGSRDDRETGKDHPDLSIASAIHGDSWHHAVTRGNGVAYVLVRPAQGRIRGQAALIQLDGEISPDFVVVPDIALHIAFPGVKNPKEGKSPEMPAGVDELDDWFDRTLQYANRQQEYKAAGRPFLNRDPRLEAMLPYAKGEKPVLLETDGALSLMAARAWASKRGIEPIYLGAQDGWKVAGYLGADRARVITGPVHSLPRNDNDPYDSPFRNASILEAAGCKVGLRTNDPEVTRNLPFQAATAAAEGLGKEAALRAITLGAAEVLGVDAFVGSLEVGKVATFFLSESDPLDFPGHVRRMWIGGGEVELSSKQTELRDRYGDRIERALKKD